MWVRLIASRFVALKQSATVDLPRPAVHWAATRVIPRVLLTFGLNWWPLRWYIGHGLIINVNNHTHAFIIVIIFQPKTRELRRRHSFVCACVCLIPIYEYASFQSTAIQVHFCRFIATRYLYEINKNYYRLFDTRNREIRETSLSQNVALFTPLNDFQNDCPLSYVYL